MKFQAFYNQAKKLIQENTDIHLPTFKKFISLFYFFLSPTEKERWKYENSQISGFSTIQQTLKQNRNMLITKELEAKLKKLKIDKRFDIT